MGPNSLISLLDLPKIELHVHLDTSLSLENVQLLRPGTDENTYRRNYIAPARCRDLQDFLRYPESSIALLQTPEQLGLAIRQLVRELRSDGVIYAEIRFAPLLHTRQGLPASEVVDSVCNAAMAAGAETGVVVRLLLCTLRSFTVEESMKTARLVLDFHDKGVVGLDLAGDEMLSLNPHIPAFRLVAEAGIPATAHAGEACGAGSVRDVVEFLGVRRIGHGVRSIEDPEVVDLLARHRIHLEVCPSSNLQTGVFTQLTDHSLDRLARAGVPLSINTDGRGLTETSLAREYALVTQAFGWSPTDFLRMNRMALEAAFVEPGLRQDLSDRLEAGNLPVA